MQSLLKVNLSSLRRLLTENVKEGKGEKKERGGKEREGGKRRGKKRKPESKIQRLICIGIKFSAKTVWINY